MLLHATIIGALHPSSHRGLVVDPTTRSTISPSRRIITGAHAARGKGFFRDARFKFRRPLTLHLGFDDLNNIGKARFVVGPGDIFGGACRVGERAGTGVVILSVVALGIVPCIGGVALRLRLLLVHYRLRLCAGAERG